MKRSQFLKSIFAGGVASIFSGVAVAQPTTEQPQTTLMQTTVAGFQFYQGNTIINQLQKGQRLTLKAQFNNRHDENAIEVYCDDVKLGYVPRMDNLIPANLLRQNKQLSARITHVRPNAHVWSKIEFEIALIN